MYIAVELNVLPAEQAAKTIDETKQLNRMMRALAKAQYNKINEIRETPKQYNLESEP
jgi:hypothetical protein